MAPRPTGLILCGGAGERLGGVDKPLQDFAGRPLLERVIERLAPQVRTLLVNAGRNVARYAGYGYPVIDDGPLTGAGPLAGVLAGFDAIDGGDLLCVPGDAPALPLDLGGRLTAARGDAAIAYADDGRGPQPLCCLLRGGLAGDLRDYLASGGRTPREWFARHRAVTADFSEVPRWGWSLNTPQEWRAAEQALDGASAGTGAAR